MEYFVCPARKTPSAIKDFFTTQGVCAYCGRTTHEDGPVNISYDTFLRLVEAGEPFTADRVKRSFKDSTGNIFLLSDASPEQQQHILELWKQGTLKVLK